MRGSLRFMAASACALSVALVQGCKPGVTESVGELRAHPEAPVIVAANAVKYASTIFDPVVLAIAFVLVASSHRWRPALRVVVKVRYAPFLTHTRGQRLPAATSDAAAIEQAALAALDRFTRRRPVRLPPAPRPRPERRIRR